MKTEIYKSIQDVPSAEWNSFCDYRMLPYDTKHLAAVERSKINGHQPYYLVAKEGDSVIGILYGFIITIDFTTLSGDITPDVRATVKTWFPDLMNYRVFECGQLDSIGKAFACVKGRENEFLESCIKAIDEVCSKESVDVILFRDIELEDEQTLKVLPDRSFSLLQGFPSTSLAITWASLEEYLKDLTAKRRKDIRNCIDNVLSCERITIRRIDDFSEYIPAMTALYREVQEKAEEYSHELLNEKYFDMINSSVPTSHIIGIFHQSELVSFGLCYEGTDTYFLAYAGINYRYNREYNLYFNTMLASLDEAIKLQKKRIEFGITAYEHKMRIGAELRPKMYAIRYLPSENGTRALAELVEKSIKVPVNEHKPFKNMDIDRRCRDERRVKQLLHPDKSSDIFAKFIEYSRSDILRTVGLYTFFPQFESAQQSKVVHEGRKVFMLGSNSYLGLTNHANTRSAAIRAIEKYGTGCSGSPFLNGTLDIHNKLCDELSEFTGKESTLLFSTGYQTNVGILSCLAGRKELLIMDERNHASLVDGARMSFGTKIKYRHNDMDSLETVLAENRNTAKIIITDSIFSMEGTIANLPAIVKLAKKYGARIMVDESHAVGVLGKSGAGACEMYGVENEVDLIMGTFSKTFSSIGGFVSGDRKIIDSLRHLARSHMFSASLPPSQIEAVRAALKIVKEGEELRGKVLNNATFLANGLKELGYSINWHGSAIISLFCGDELLCLALYKKLFETGVFTNPVLSPAIPKGQEMLRISLLPDFSEEDLKEIVGIFRDVRTAHFPVIPKEKRMISFGSFCFHSLQGRLV